MAKRRNRKMMAWHDSNVQNYMALRRCSTVSLRNIVDCDTINEKSLCSVVYVFHVLFCVSTKKILLHSKRNDFPVAMEIIPPFYTFESQYSCTYEQIHVILNNLHLNKAHNVAEFGRGFTSETGSGASKKKNSHIFSDVFFYEVPGIANVYSKSPIKKWKFARRNVCVAIS